MNLKSALGQSTVKLLVLEQTELLALRGVAPSSQWDLSRGGATIHSGLIPISSA